MGKRARSAHRADAKSSSRPAASTASSRHQRDQAIDERMNAITAKSKFSQPRITRVQRGKKRGRVDEEEEGEDVMDEIDQFHHQRDFIALDTSRDDEERDEDEDELAHSRVLDLPDREEEEVEEEEADEEEEEDLAPLPLDDLLDEDDAERHARSIAEEQRVTTAWGRNKKLYYSADTVDYELESDEEVAKAEEEEASRLMQATLKERRPEDYTLGELMLIKSNKPAPAPSASSALSLLDELGAEAEVEKVEREGGTEEEKVQMMIERHPELLGLIEDLKTRMEEVDEVRKTVTGRGRKGGGGGVRGEWVRSLETVLLMYCSCGLVYLAMKGESKSMQSHPINQQLLQLRTQLTRLLALRQTFEDVSEEQVNREKEKGSKQTAEEKKKKKKEEEQKEEGEKEEEMAEEYSEQDEVEDEEEAEVEEQKVALRKKVDIFSSLPKPSSKPFSLTSRPVPSSSSSSISRFDDFNDDGDLPAVQLHNRKKLKSSVKPSNAATLPSSLDPSDHFSSDDEGRAVFEEEEEDEEAEMLYDNLSKQRQAKLASRRPPPPSSIGIPDLSADVVSGKRRIGRMIEKNEGLKASRPKDRKNPKTRNRARYEKALIKRRSQVREYKGQGGVYGGEATGIKRNVAKSVRIKD